MNNIVEMLRDEADIIAGEGATEYSVKLLVAAANRIEELEASQSKVPAGWKLVPIEPTYEMRRKAGLHKGADFYTISRVWNEMLSAAPQPPRGGEGNE